MSGYGKIYESSYWGVGVCDNTIGWGSSYKSIANCTDASFSYPLDSYPTNGVNPTPTITGDAGGTFTATPSGLTLNASTGEITLSTSTVNSYTIRYTLPDTTFAEQSMQITAPPFSSTRSFSFDGVDDYFDTNQSLNSSYSALSLSAWVNYTTLSSYTGTIFGQWIQNNNSGSTIICYTVSNKIQVYLGPSASSLTSTTTISTGNWYNVVLRFDGSTMKLYINGTEEDSVSLTSINNSAQNLILGAYSNSTQTGFQAFLNGNLDEVSIWNSSLSTDAITEIYNLGVPNDLESLSNASSSNIVAWYRMGE